VKLIPADGAGPNTEYKQTKTSKKKTHKCSKEVSFNFRQTSERMVLLQEGWVRVIPVHRGCNHTFECHLSSVCMKPFVWHP